jgi:hypothetical protein
LFLEPWASFGNHIIAFVHARYVAKILKVFYIACHPDFGSFGRPARVFLADGVEVVITSPDFEIPFAPFSVLRGTFFWAPAPCPDWSWKDVLRDGADEFLRTPFRPLNLTDRQIVLVLRGGSEMWTDPHHSGVYSQAPCAFFLEVMRNFSEAIVVGGDGSPCREPAVAAGAQSVQWDPIEGTRYMIWAKNVMFARTSRSHAVIALAPFLSRFWLFDTESEMKVNPRWWRGFKPYEFAEGYDCKASNQYITALTPWVPTPEQIDIVRHGNCTFERVVPPNE